MSMHVELVLNPAAAEEVVSAARAGLRGGAEHIRQLSDPNVPVDTGFLIGTGLVDQDEDEAAVSYNGIAPDGFDYGIHNHEDLSLNHPNGGGPKWLENALQEGADGALTEVAIPIRRVLGA